MNPARHIIVSIVLAAGLVANAAWARDTMIHKTGFVHVNGTTCIPRRSC